MPRCHAPLFALLFAAALSAQGDVARESCGVSTLHGLVHAGGIEAGITALAVYHQTMPPTINQDTPDPECNLDYVPWKARTAPITYALSNSFGFGGTNAALLLRRFDG